MGANLSGSIQYYTSCYEFTRKSVKDSVRKLMYEHEPSNMHGVRRPIICVLMTDCVGDEVSDMQMISEASF